MNGIQRTASDPNLPMVDVDSEEEDSPRYPPRPAIVPPLDFSQLIRSRIILPDKTNIRNWGRPPIDDPPKYDSPKYDSPEEDLPDCSTPHQLPGALIIDVNASTRELSSPTESDEFSFSDEEGVEEEISKPPKKTTWEINYDRFYLWNGYESDDVIYKVAMYAITALSLFTIMGLIYLGSALYDCCEPE